MAARTRFDDQAAGFDTRVGLGENVARTVAAAVLAHFPSSAVLEIGPGTGELGIHLAFAARRYVGFDSSLPMLSAFATRQLPPQGLLVLADAGQAWPVRSHAIDLVFAGRAAHLLEPAHAAAEVTRVGRPGATFVVGRVERPRDGLRNRLRRVRRQLLAEHGVGASDGREKDRRLLDALSRVPGAGAGPVPIAVTTVAAWPVRTKADDVIANWEANGVAGGRPVPAPVATTVVDRLRAEFAGESETESETYTLEGVRLP